MMSSLERKEVTWVINSRGLAEKVKNAGLPAAYQIKDCGAKIQCPNCHYLIDDGDVSNDWPGLPAGVKFDPSDIELLDHLAAKHGVGDLEPHKFIDEFIPTLEGDEGICYTHPENLPGAKKDGSSIHFFYKITNAYSTGQRKRRRIQDKKTMIDTHVRWHKTGKTKPILANGVQKGFKKIMVLYSATKRGSKPDKCKWIMHQFHLGTDEDEKQGEHVVSKVFYQLKENDRNDSYLTNEEPDRETNEVIPRTPKTNTPDPPRPENTPPPSGADDYFIQSVLQEPMCVKEQCHPTSLPQLKEEIVEYATPLAEDTEPVKLGQGQSLLYREVVDSYPDLGVPKPGAASSTQTGNNSTHDIYGIDDLNNIELDTPPDFQLSDLQFDSQDSIFEWLDQL